jgi:hypothetical protein
VSSKEAKLCPTRRVAARRRNILSIIIEIFKS